MTVAALGFFDGVHLGHRAILQGADRAVTFRNHPLSVLAPEKAPALLMTAEDRVAAIRACGVGTVTVLDFTPELAALTPEAFVARHLSDVGAVRCGPDARFGRGGAGDAAWLGAHGVDVTVVPPVLWEGVRVSSTRIRVALAEANLDAANAMLGRPYAVPCTSRRGKGLGAKIGFPTVNFVPEGVVPPLPRGAYAVRVRDMPGVANWGIAPTMGADAWPASVLEVHFPEMTETALPDFSDTRLPVSFLRYLRPEKRFGSLADLVEQLACDVANLASCKSGVEPS